MNDSFEAGRNVVLVREKGSCAAKVVDACTYCDGYGLHKGSQLAVGEDCQGGFNIAVVSVDRTAVNLVSPQEDKSPLPKDLELEARRLLSTSLESLYRSPRTDLLPKVLNDPPKVLRVEHGMLLLFMKTELVLSNYMYDEEHRKYIAKRWEHEEPILVVNNSVVPSPTTKYHLFFSVNGKLHLACIVLHPSASHSIRNVYDLSGGRVTKVYDDEHRSLRDKRNKAPRE